MSGIYGNISAVETTGASRETAAADRLSFYGVKASEQMARHDLESMEKHREKIEHVARKLHMDPSVIAGIISRETRAGDFLSSNGYASDGFGYGLMQIDRRWLQEKLKSGPYSLKHIKQGTEILIDMIKRVKENFPEWTDEMALKGGIRAYNAGFQSIRSYKRMDAATTGGDYANDVVARAQYYKRKGY